MVAVTTPITGLRGVRLGGSGGDSRLDRTNVDDSLFQDNLNDEFWSNFDKRDGEGPSSKSPSRS